MYCFEYKKKQLLCFLVCKLINISIDLNLILVCKKNAKKTKRMKKNEMMKTVDVVIVDISDDYLPICHILKKNSNQLTWGIHEC